MAISNSRNRSLNSPLAHAYKPALHQLDSLLSESVSLWRPQPYKERRSAWSTHRPELTEALLQLSDRELAVLNDNHEKLLNWLIPFVPELVTLQELNRLPTLSTTPLTDLGPHFNISIPGRKLTQIEAFAGAVGKISHPIVEWCGGKGHLGRQLAANWQQPVTTLELNPELCDAGEHLAGRAQIDQRFHRIDVLSEESTQHLPKHHSVALHACGDLHRTLIKRAVDALAPAIDVAPCCYHLGQSDEYHPFSEGLQLKLNRDELRLAVTETVTSSARDLKWRDQEMAWKLGYEQLRQEISGSDHYQSMKPIDKSWLRGNFKIFCKNLALREKLNIDYEIDWPHYESLGWQRQREVMRLSLLRNAFRRPLEMWLVLDIANYLSVHHYSVVIGEFCPRKTTPRNILISARRNSSTSDG
ncbi:MAG: SAM-dependent methyltransferase [Gammaproteobacteria bacterium]|nr:SAM-dependent methyltransferase [Gammaproteobacteria bacterium]